MGREGASRTRANVSKRGLFVVLIAQRIPLKKGGIHEHKAVRDSRTKKIVVEQGPSPTPLKLRLPESEGVACIGSSHPTSPTPNERPSEQPTKPPTHPTTHPACHPTRPPTCHPTAVEETTCGRDLTVTFTSEFILNQTVKRKEQQSLREKQYHFIIFKRSPTMEGSGTGIGRIDCYEDMFKEITRKLYGDDTDQRSTSVQNEFETVSFKTEGESENGTDDSDDGNWIIEEEPLKGTDGSRIAAYHVGKSTWKCYECCELITGIPREVAEHYMDLHYSDSRNRHRKEYLQTELKQEDVIMYLEKVRERAERIAPPLRRTQETQTVPPTLLPMTSTFLLQEISSVNQQQQQIQQQTSNNLPAVTTTPATTKRYTCPICSYSTDRRDLFTRHENIHRLEKPFQCYACNKPFNRADHVKKHFTRMHREQPYDISRIRRTDNSSSTTQRNLQQSTSPANGNAQQNVYPATFNNNRIQIQSSGTSTIFNSPLGANAELVQSDANKKIQNGMNGKNVKGGQKGQEKRYSCDFCSWTGVDNWCLKRHLNTHLKPYACSLCEYKAARSERLTTHVLKVHNRRQCSRCTFLAEDTAQLQAHQMQVHRVGGVNTTTTIASTPVASTTPPQVQNSRLQQQTIHPMGGRPPPGPPVFPASSPAISQSPSVLPASTMLGDFMAFVEALRRVYRTDDEVNRILGCEPGSPMDMLIKCYMSSTTKCQIKNSEESSEDSQTESDACDSQNQTSYKRFKMRKQKMPRKACTFSEDEDYMEDCQEDVTALCTTASVLVQPMENRVANSFEHIDSGSVREQSNDQ